MDIKKEASLSDKPINDGNEDKLHLKEHFVQRVYQFISNKGDAPLTIAITGEWGIGKSSAINLLCKQLEKDTCNIIVRFEPLLEGKLEIADILASFYLKLFNHLSRKRKLTRPEKQKFKNLMLGLKMANGIFNVISSGTPINYLSKGIDVALKLGEKTSKNGAKTFEEQTEELNAVLEGYKLYVIMDEIDRLNATHILNFLLFTRTIESIDNITCIVGMDYRRVIQKLSGEKNPGLGDSKAAQDYLDKLFQVRFHVDINEFRKINYCFDKLKTKAIDVDEILRGILESTDYDTQRHLGLIIHFLYTPRQIIKWLLSIKANYTVIKYSSDELDAKLALLGFLAVATKYPIVIDIFTKHALYIRQNFYGNYSGYISENYTATVGNAKDDNKSLNEAVLLAGFGVNDKSKKIEGIENLLKEILGSHSLIEEKAAIKLVKKFIAHTPVFIMLLLSGGFDDENTVAAYSNYFNKDINSTLKILLDNNDFSRTLAFDLANDIERIKLNPICQPDKELLNKLWRQHIVNSVELGNPYIRIALHAASQLPVDSLIRDLDLEISERYLHEVLAIFGIKNVNGFYNWRDYDNSKAQSSTNNPVIKINYKNIRLENLGSEHLFEIMSLWVDKAEEAFSKNNSKAFETIRSISILYRFIQWGNATKRNNDELLPKYIINFINNDSVNDASKERLIELINTECAKCFTDFGKSEISPIRLLFSNDADVIKSIKNFSAGRDIKYMDAFLMLTSDEKTPDMVE